MNNTTETGNEVTEEEIGYVCFKGPHPAFRGETDYGCCGSKAYARITLRVEPLHPNPRGEGYTAAEAADHLSRVVADAERFNSDCAAEFEEENARLRAAITSALGATDSVGDQLIWDSAEAHDILEAALRGSDQ